jgi:hypothetical protein
MQNMERITNYMYEHTDDFKESNYLDIMRLLNKPLKPKEQYTCYWSNQNSFNGFEKHSSSEIIISEYQLVDIMQSVYNNNVENVMNSLRDLVPSNYSIKPDKLFKYHFVFPDSLDNADRQKIHIMSSVSGKFRTISKFIDIDYSGKWKKQLSIFINKF